MNNKSPSKSKHIVKFRTIQGKGDMLITYKTSIKGKRQI